MSELTKASQDAIDAARQGEQFALMLAAIQAAQAVQPPACQHPAPVPQTTNVGKWLALGAGASVLLATLALFAVAVAIGAITVAIAALVLRTLWRDFQRG